MVVRKKKWKFSEERIILDNYENCTIKELLTLLPGRDQNQINMKIKSLKKQNRLTDTKDAEARIRAYKQRVNNDA